MTNQDRRKVIKSVVLAGSISAFSFAFAQSSAPLIEVWKDPNCGCCKDWISHIEKAGFKVKVNDTGNNSARTRLGVSQKFASCHTATIGKYVIEGHVPASDIQRLLKEKPTALGLAAPGMPVGSPGMDGEAYKGRKDAYSVLLVQRDGSSTVFQSH
ncbi:DUF411 domain-containing protein [Ottowia testudinis]|uniref:DUF411 domain-containing protein n=1 Tax=Ottowia testudinis TaxID=2816950 RepID=A0A975CG56_9BURK|nr:DUF411 domain-containing protein [Ottowia testudinis]QTD44949.1 DUF411 domain-containing protein [Ottowia testudinis]